MTFANLDFLLSQSNPLHQLQSGYPVRFRVSQVGCLQDCSVLGAADTISGRIKGPGGARYLPGTLSFLASEELVVDGGWKIGVH